MSEKLWIVVSINESSPKWPPALSDYKVDLLISNTIRGFNNSQNFRSSPIFPIQNKYIKPSLEFCNIHFFCIDPAYPVIGKILKNGSDRLKQSVFFSIGLASIILITNDSSLDDEFLGIVNSIDINSDELWSIENGVIINCICNIRKKDENIDNLLNRIVAYDDLPQIEISILDEFVSNVAVIIPKVKLHIPYELGTFENLIQKVNDLITELLYVNKPFGSPPITLDEYSEEEFLANPSLCEKIKNQDIDRIIQINSTLSYVSTQALSGAVPILERRSIIRRQSLLGIGTAILALTRIARSIEFGFAQFPVDEIIKLMGEDHSKPIPNINNYIDRNMTDWARYSIDSFSSNINPRNLYPKLPFFSGRLGFRETEYSISASIESISGGANPEWSLLTISHEMLHGLVRILISAVFQHNPSENYSENWNLNYKNFVDYMLTKNLDNFNLLDSIRGFFFAYCHYSLAYGSLTRKTTLPSENNELSRTNTRFDFYIFKNDQEKNILEIFKLENRNIQEIMVHVLDYHYFYESQLELYIPLIWSTWSSAPIVRTDLRQYILRSLLVISISPSIDFSPHQRFERSVEKFLELISEEKEYMNKIAIIGEVRKFMNNQELVNELCNPFNTGLIIADLTNNIFRSGNIRAKFYLDPNVKLGDDLEGINNSFEYLLPDGFYEEKIQSPVAYLLDRLRKRLISDTQKIDEERYSTEVLLACASSVT